MLTEETTTVNKGRDGFKAETYFVNEETKKAVLVSTWKKSYGGGLETHYQYGKADNDRGYSSFSYMMFQDKSGKLCSNPTARCTEKTIRELHTQSLEKFRTEHAEAIAETELQEVN